MNDLYILFGVIFSYIILLSHKSYYYILIFTLAFSLNYKHLFDKGIFQLKKLFKLILILIFNYIFIKEHNPIYYLIFFFLPFCHLFKGIFILIITSKYIQDTKTSYFIDKQIKAITSTKLRMFLTYIILCLIHFLTIMYNEKYFVYFHNKSSLINTNEKYYIASNLYNNEDILPDWIKEMKKLINYLGKDKVYISIYENGDSADNTTRLLLEFESYLNNLNISNKIVLTHSVNRFKFPRIDEELAPGEKDTPEKKAKRELNIFYRKLSERVTFLSILRNKAMEYLYEISDLDYNNTRILFFNDIIFNYEDVINLISTNKRDYDVACGMDFYWAFYDSYVSIDLNGQRLMDHFPYFFNKQAADAFLDGDNIRVFSCWNGLISAKAQIFENKKIMFRNISVVNSIPISECTLFNYDNYINGYGKVIINPHVIFSYRYDTYYSYKYVARWLYEPFWYFVPFIHSVINSRDYRMTDLITPIFPLSSNLTNYTEFFNFSYFYK